MFALHLLGDISVSFWETSDTQVFTLVDRPTCPPTHCKLFVTEKFPGELHADKLHI